MASKKNLNKSKNKKKNKSGKQKKCLEIIDETKLKKCVPEEFDFTSESISEDINKTIKIHTLSKLIEFANKYNSACSKDEYILPLKKLEEKYGSNIDKFIELLIICLWEREIDIPSELSFGNPFDKILMGWAINCDDNDNKICKNDKNGMYLILTHPELTRQYLFYYLNRIDRHKTDKTKHLVEVFNHILHKLNKKSVKNREEFLQQSRNYTPLELCYLVYKSEGYIHGSYELFSFDLEEFIRISDNEILKN